MFVVMHLTLINLMRLKFARRQRASTKMARRGSRTTVPASAASAATASRLAPNCLATVLPPDRIPSPDGIKRSTSTRITTCAAPSAGPANRNAGTRRIRKSLTIPVSDGSTSVRVANAWYCLLLFCLFVLFLFSKIENSCVSH